jgi:MFS family permease
VSFSLKLPAIKDRNILLFYFLTFANNSFFITGNWIFFWLRYMTYGQLGLVDAGCFAFGMLMEIPTGAISDLLGKKRTLIAAHIFAALGFFVIGTSTAMTQIVIGFLLAQVGWAFLLGCC